MTLRMAARVRAVPSSKSGQITSSPLEQIWAGTHRAQGTSLCLSVTSTGTGRDVQVQRARHRAPIAVALLSHCGDDMMGKVMQFPEFHWDQRSLAGERRNKRSCLFVAEEASSYVEATAGALKKPSSVRAGCTCLRIPGAADCKGG